MINASTLPYYPRFIFNCDDDRCFSTGDLDELEYIKESGTDYDVTRFVPNQILDISWSDGNGGFEIKSYSVDKIEIHQIKRDLDEPTYGINMNDCAEVYGREKKWMMEIYVFLKLIK